MRPSGPSFPIRLNLLARRLPSIEGLICGLVALATAWVLVFVLSVSVAQASATLVVETQPGLSLLSDAVTLRIEGTGTEPQAESELSLRFYGPAEPSQIGQSNPLLPEAASISTTVGASLLPEQAATVTGSEMWSVEVSVPGGLLEQPGGYLVIAELRSGGVVGSSGQNWLGKVAPRAAPLDVAFVLPVALGVHRNPSGAFFDDVLEQAVTARADNPMDLRAVTTISSRFPNLRFTLAVEPILLTQLRDMADGYVSLDGSGAPVEVSPEDPPAKNAAEVLAAFRDLANRETVEIAAGPYAGADLAALATEGWRDGFDQIQLGKRELQKSLGLEAPPIGAYSPDLDMTNESLAYYGQASIDHVVVDGGLAADLTEPVGEEAVAARVRDIDNDRVTLVLANSRLHVLMAPPWDPALFYAGFAAELAAVPRDAVVLVTGGDFAVPPALYLEAVCESLSGASWIQTHTLTSLLDAHAPDTRPVLLTRTASGTQGYIEGALLDSLRAAHVAVADLATAADPTEGAVEDAHRLLYCAESRWWWHPQTSPEVASIGLLYAEEAEIAAQNELDKVSLAEASPERIWGRQGTLKLAVDNEADYPLEVEAQLTGDGILVLDESDFIIELQPGRNEVLLEIETAGDPYLLQVRLLAGSSLLDEDDLSVRPLTLMTFLPWVLAAVVLIGAVVFAFLWLRRRRSRA